MRFGKFIALASLVCLTSCSNNPEKPKTESAAPAAAPAPKPDVGPLGEMAFPADNPMTPEKVELGKKLFFDTRLSKTGKMSCESCHHPDKG
jgi:cytochrome c peroxidase